MSKIEIAEETMTRGQRSEISRNQKYFLKENREKIDVSPGFIWLVNIC